jgi:hypothetical protein
MARAYSQSDARTRTHSQSFAKWNNALGPVSHEVLLTEMADARPILALIISRAARYSGVMSPTNRNDRRLERERLVVVIATIVINVIAVSLLTFAPWSDWRTGAALNFVDNCLLVGFVVVRRDTLLARFLLF